jgi:broad specificity phosphatase PhoE
MIYVMRHGESVVNLERRLTCRKLDGDLSPLGQQQARQAAAWLRDKDIRAIFTSPFHRAEQTAQMIGDVLGLTPTVDGNLAEMDCGELEGRTDEDAWDIWAEVFERWKTCDWECRFPGGETFRQAHDRLVKVLLGTTDLLEKNGGSALLVTHGGITRAVLPYLCVNAAALQRISHLHNTGIAVFEPYDPGRYACMAWDIVEHLN